MSVNIKPYIIINGKNSNEITGLMITKLPPISKPAMRVEAEEIDGRDGDIVTELGFSAYDKEIEIGLYGEYDVNDVIEYFNQSGQVIFSNEPDKYYRFAIYNAIDFEKLINFKTATVIFHVQPFKFDVESNDAVFFSPSNVSITNEGNIYSRPELAIQGSGNVGISVNGSDVLEIELGASQQAIIIDSDGMNAYGTKSNIKELIVDVNPVQDLHGYDSPWVGGAGKNKCNATVRAQVLDAGITSQVYEDNRIVASGKSTGNGDIGVDLSSDLVLSSGTNYTLSLTGTNTRSGTLSVYFRVKGGSYSSPIGMGVNSNSISFSNLNGTYDRILLRTTSGNTVTIDAKMMIEEGSTATSYAPYENICPISGWDGCDVTRTGANIWGGEALLQDFINANISNFAYNTTEKTMTYGAVAISTKEIKTFELKENQQYTFIIVGSNSLNYNSTNLRLYYSDGTNDVISFPSASANTKQICVFTTRENKTITRLVGVNSAGTTTLYYDECGFFEGTITADDFQRYVGNPYSSYFEGLLNGTYGYVDLGTLPWTYNASYGMSSIGIKDNVKKPSSTSTIVNCICPIRKSASFSQIVSAGTSGNLIGFYTDGSLCINTTETMPTEFTTAMSGIYLIYELATPTTPSITQADINMLMTAFGIDGTSAIVVFGQTVYEAKLNVTTGVLTLTHVISSFNDLSWTYQSNYTRFYTTSIKSVVAPPSSASVIANGFACECYNPHTYNSTYNGDIYLDGTGNLFVKDFNFTDSTAWLALVGDYKIKYPLAEPQTIQLTAQEIMTLIGENVLWANTGAINELIYTKDGVDITTSGDIVSFDVDAIDIIDTILKNRLVTGNYDNLRLKAGTNQIAVSGNVNVMVLSNFSRWL